MGFYYFEAKDASGNKHKGEIEVIDKSTLVAQLQQQGLVPIAIKEKRRGGYFSIPKLTNRVSRSEIVSFTRQLSTMISTGLPLTDALIILQSQTKSHALAEVLTSVIADVEGGMALSKAFSKHPQAFNAVYVKLLEAGETGGVLDKILAKLADTLEKERDFKAKTRGAFIYPAIVVGVMIIVISIMMIFVIPKLAVLYEEVDAKLPLPTRILIAISSFMTNFWWLLLGLVIFAIVIYARYSHTKKGQEIISYTALKLPVWGRIRQTLILAQFTRTLGLLVAAGVPIVVALKVVADLLESAPYRESLDIVIKRVERGSSLHEPLVADPIFPPIIGQMVRVGEETGKMDEVLGRLSIYFESESENLIRNLTAALEPVILVILGLGVGILVLSIILPIYNLTSQF
ncbi:MAG: type II secretion system F family protein [Candidatus Curtissbacteria bacterium]|nr:type II secretion system F family protein [Candidatus Curtissbacteria bacterium]